MWIVYNMTLSMKQQSRVTCKGSFLSWLSLWRWFYSQLFTGRVVSKSLLGFQIIMMDSFQSWTFFLCLKLVRLFWAQTNF